MRFFKEQEREPADALYHMAKEPDRDWSDVPEMDELCAILSRNGVEHHHEDVGPYRSIQFKCGHGERGIAYALHGPGTRGSERGLLEAYCPGWDMGKRGGLTAREVYETYMQGFQWKS